MIDGTPCGVNTGHDTAIVSAQLQRLKCDGSVFPTFLSRRQCLAASLVPVAKKLRREKNKPNQSNHQEYQPMSSLYLRPMPERDEYTSKDRSNRSAG